jgi:hypothetical protein
MARAPQPMRDPLLHGVDFTSAPRRAKPIVVATLERIGVDAARFVGLEALTTWSMFDDFLMRPGPWVAGFDVPFGLPRPLVEALGWPTDWLASIAHYASLDRATLRTTFKAWCDARPVGSKFAHRATDGPAGSSPSMKWVNPPVAWMLHAGVPRLIDARVLIPGLREHDVDRTRVALEAYPGWLARSITRASYKSDTRAQQTEARRAAREAIVSALADGRHALEIRLALDASACATLVDDASGDSLDATLCALEAAWADEQRRAGHARYGLPDDIDPLEGWIVGVPATSSFPRRRESSVVRGALNVAGLPPSRE